jgi:hypothetical protein
VGDVPPSLYASLERLTLAGEDIVAELLASGLAHDDTTDLPGAVAERSRYIARGVVEVTHGVALLTAAILRLPPPPALRPAIRPPPDPGLWE